MNILIKTLNTSDDDFKTDYYNNFYCKRREDKIDNKSFMNLMIRNNKALINKNAKNIK